ncbi:hypothetical protein Efla_002077 [Eimeria flavescens]
MVPFLPLRLARFPDPAEAHRRRGAPWTINLQAFWSTLQLLKYKAGPVTVPVFDHARKDPDINGCVVATDTRVVLVEGLYTLLAGEEASLAPSVLDVRIFIDTPKPVAASRVIRRHVESGICSDEEEAKRRWLDNDSLNADYILSKLRLEQIDAVVRGEA